MGRFLFADRATWYFGGDRDIDWVGTGEREAFAAFLRRSSFCVRDSGLNLLVWKALLGVLGAVGSTGFGCDAFDRFEGRMGFGSGGCALSLSVTASAAARSAARCACCDVDGASEDAFGGNEGFDEALGEVEVCKDGSTCCEISYGGSIWTGKAYAQTGIVLRSRSASVGGMRRLWGLPAAATETSKGLCVALGYWTANII